MFQEMFSLHKLFDFAKVDNITKYFWTMKENIYQFPRVQKTTLNAED